MTILLVNMANIQCTLTYVNFLGPELENVRINFVPTKKLPKIQNNKERTRKPQIKLSPT